MKNKSWNEKTVRKEIWESLERGKKRGTGIINYKLQK